MRRFPKLLLVSVVACATAFALCDTPRREERSPRIVESTPEIFVPDLRKAPVKEQLIDVTSALPPPEPPAHARTVARVPPKWLERAVAETPVENPTSTQPFTSLDLEPATPAPPPRFLPPPPLPATPPVSREEPPRAPDRGLTDATHVAVAVGILGLGMSAASLGAGDGMEGEKWIGASWLGVGAAAFGTAGVLYAIDPNPQKNKVRILAGPGLVGVRGSF